MKKILAFTPLLLTLSIAFAQGYTGALRTEYKDENGRQNNTEVFIKDNKYYIRKISGGAKYSGYILDVTNHSLTCLNDQGNKTAVIFDIDKVLPLYEKNNYLPGYKVHNTQAYRNTGATEKIGEQTAAVKKAIADSFSYEIMTADLHINMQRLIPVLRLAGFWGSAEDGNNAILKGKVTNRKTSRTSTMAMTPVKIEPDTRLFDVPKEYQVVDINKFMADQAHNAKMADFVRGFVGI
ncbi:MAG: hypothetical protein JST83_13660 [Bacteroidetes bacterium]|nr:hypothetical protein [Bacteroidota bacterium]